MQRHFSNRGERVSEVTAARMLAGRKAKSGMMREGRRASTEEWFSHPVEALSRPKRKPPRGITDATVFL